jgi:MFS family permease
MSGFFFILFSSNANTMIQLKVEDVYRGRVMSVYNLVFGGTLPIGNMIAGLVVDRCNARAGFYVCGISIAVLSMLLTGLYHRLHL